MQISIYKQFWNYVIPTIAAMLVSGFYQVVDGIFIGRYVGADGLAGINVAWPVIGTILGLGMLVGVGSGALISIRQGEGDHLGANHILTTGLILLVVLSPAVSGLLYLFGGDFLAWQGAKGRLFELGDQYLSILTGACVFTLGSIAMPFLIRNDDSPTVATLLMVIGAVVNIALDYLMIAVWGWELKGAAIATAIAQAVVTLLGVAYFCSPSAKLKLNNLRFNWGVIPQIFSIGTSSFFMYAYGSMMVALHNSLFTQYGDALTIGAYAILSYIVTVYYLTVEGVANGMQPLVSFNHGARNQTNIGKLLNISMVTSISIGIGFTLLLNIFPHEFVTVFNSSDNQLLERTVLGIRLHMFALFLDGFLVVAAAYYQATNKGSKAMFVTLGNLLIQLPFLFIMPKLFGVPGIWLAYPLSNIALGVIVAVMLIKDVRHSMRIDEPIITTQY